MSLTPEQTQAANTALDDLEAKRFGGYLSALGTWAADESAKNAALSFWDTTCVNSIASLRRELDRVASGEISWDRWVNDAGSLYKSMADVAGYSSDWSMTSVLWNTAVSTGQQVGQGLQDIGAAAKSGTTWGVGAFILAGLAFLYLRRKV